MSATPADPGRLLATCRAVRVPRPDAAVGLPGLPGRRGAAVPDFHLVMQAEVTGLRGTAAGCAASRPATPDGDAARSTADLTVAADGRASRVRALAGMAVRELGVPVDVLWFRLPKPTRRPPATLGLPRRRRPGPHHRPRRLLPGRDADPEGRLDRIRARGPAGAASRLVRAAPVLRDVVGALQSLGPGQAAVGAGQPARRWYRPGLLCIGDAAHAMSPAFGVGVNYAVQDAIATANLLAADCAEGRCDRARTGAGAAAARAAGAADAADPAGAAPPGGPPRRPCDAGPRATLPAPGTAARTRRAARSCSGSTRAPRRAWASAPSGCARTT